MNWARELSSLQPSLLTVCLYGFPDTELGGGIVCGGPQDDIRFMLMTVVLCTQRRYEASSVHQHLSVDKRSQNTFKRNTINTNTSTSSRAALG